MSSLPEVPSMSSFASRRRLAPSLVLLLSSVACSSSTGGVPGAAGTSAAGSSAGVSAQGGAPQVGGAGGSSAGASGSTSAGTSGEVGGGAGSGQAGSPPGGFGGDTSSGGMNQAGSETSLAGEGGAGSGGDGDTGTPGPDSDLETRTGCAGVFNPDQLLDYAITMAGADYAALLADASFSQSFPATLACGEEAPLSVTIARKRSGGATKVGLKIDLNDVVSGQTFHGLKKLGLENGVSSGSTADDAGPRDVIGEYLGWRLMQRALVIGSRAAFARVRVNDGPFMAYVNVEQVDKRFLSSRFGEDEGWLYKKSGGDGDGLKTHETDGVENPYESRFCFWHGGCAVPSSEDLLQDLPLWLDIPQMLAFGAVNAFISNPDGMFFKDNNYYFYDSPAGRRTYLPWDLDTTMGRSVDVLEGGVPGGTTKFSSVLFSHWRSDYEAILRRLLDQDLTRSVIESEIDRAVRVGGAAVDADPALDGTAAEAAGELTTWWVARREALAAQIP